MCTLFSAARDRSVTYCFRSNEYDYENSTSSIADLQKYVNVRISYHDQNDPEHVPYSGRTTGIVQKGDFSGRYRAFKIKWATPARFEF